MKLVSVVIPVYNVKKYLEKCVDSVLKQEYRNIEVVLVDDGSTDGSGELCDLYASRDKRIVVLHNANSGPSAARNSGIKAATGEYILFVDSDDYIAPQLISTVVKKAIESNADIVMFDAEAVDENGGHIEYFNAFQNKFNSDFLNMPQVLLSLPALWNKLYRRELFMNNNVFIPENICIGEDFTVNTQLLSLSQKTDYCNEALYYYVQHGNSLISGTFEDKTKALRNEDVLVACQTIRNYFSSNGSYGDYREVLDYLTVYYVFTAVIRINKAGASIGLQAKMVNYVLEQCESLEKNKYYNHLSSRKQRILFFLLRHKLFRTLHFVLTLNRRLTGR